MGWLWLGVVGGGWGGSVGDAISYVGPRGKTGHPVCHENDWFGFRC